MYHIVPNKSPITAFIYHKDQLYKVLISSAIYCLSFDTAVAHACGRSDEWAPCVRQSSLWEVVTVSCELK